MTVGRNKMNLRRKLLIFFGAAFSIITVLILILFLYIVIAQPFGFTFSNFFRDSDDAQSTYDHPLLNKQQEQILESSGFDIEEIPTEMTGEQYNCAVEKLGQERVDEIAAGGQLRTSDIIKAGSCF